MRSTVLVLFLIAGCGDDESSGCDGTVASIAPDQMGSIIATGNFALGQPIVEVVEPNGDTMDYPATDYTGTSATFTMLPPGMHQVRWILSCFNDEGQVNINGPSSITVP